MATSPAINIGEHAVRHPSPITARRLDKVATNLDKSLIWLWGLYMKHLGETVIAQQQQIILRAVEKHVKRGEPYAVVDFPGYPNVGDSLIWLGLTKVLRQVSGRRPSFVSGNDLRSVDDLKKAMPRGNIFICGGGNFGDIWQNHQDFRYALMEAFPDRKIIQMPQSLQFRNPKNIEACRSAIAKHGNVHLMVRDHRSLDFVNENLGCPVELVPDTAFYIGQLQTADVPKSDTFYLMRTDVEKKGGVDISKVLAIDPGPVADWLEEPTSAKRKSIGSFLKMLSSGKLSVHALKERHYEDVANRRLKRGIETLSAGRRVVSDRLHVHILSLLLNLPHIALDNDYGKIHGYIDAWTSKCALVSKATTAEEVIQAMASGPFESDGIWKRFVNGVAVPVT